MKTILFTAVLAAGALAGCATRESSNVYKAGEAQREQTVRFGTVDSVREVQIQGYLRAWEALPPSVERIVVLRDTPYRRTHSGACIEEAVRRREEPGQVCAIPRATALKPDPAAQAARRSTDPRVHLVDLTHYFCGPQLCYPVVGGALVHKDTTHISLAFGLTLGPYLLRAFDAQEI